MPHQVIKDFLNSAISSTVENISRFAVCSEKNFTRRKKIPADQLISFLISQGASGTKNEFKAFCEIVDRHEVIPGCKNIYIGDCGYCSYTIITSLFFNPSTVAISARILIPIRMSCFLCAFIQFMRLFLSLVDSAKSCSCWFSLVIGLTPFLNNKPCKICVLMIRI